jgi:hypothetical protein
MVVHTCNPSTEAGSCLGYIVRAYLKEQNKQEVIQSKKAEEVKV